MPNLRSRCTVALATGVLAFPLVTAAAPVAEARPAEPSGSHSTLAAPSILAQAQATITVHITASNPFDDDPGPAVAGVTVRLLAGGVTVAEAVTDADGEVFFGNLDAGSYRVVFPSDPTLVPHDVTRADARPQDRRAGLPRDHLPKARGRPPGRRG